MRLDEAYSKFSKTKNHGIICPLSYIKSITNAPIGEFRDLILFAEFAKLAGFQIIQLLPIFDTGPLASPYSARSCYALHPIYLSIDEIRSIDKNDPNYKILYSLNQNSSLEFEKIYYLKMELLKTALEKDKAFILNNPDFNAFLQKQSWVIGYSIFCAHKKHTDTFPLYWHEEMEELKTRYQNEIFFYQALQFYCYQQFEDAIKAVHSKNIFVMGDIPILLSPDSCEMWTHAHLFDHTLTVGAPPDDFSKEGQSWGFPLMRFLSKPQACAHFWRSRVDHLAPYFDLYRIDHMVGFFRLWAIPRGKKASEGFFFPQDESFCLMTAEKILGILFKHTPIAPIAEDLGVIPDFVKTFIQKTHLCGTKVLRWERLWRQKASFIPLSDYPHFSMACVSTHDTSFLFDELTHYPENLKALCESLEIPFAGHYSKVLQYEILKKVHESSSLFVINLIQEYMYLDDDLDQSLERINDPSDQLRANWCTRMPKPIESYIEDKKFIKKLHAVLGVS